MTKSIPKKRVRSKPSRPEARVGIFWIYKHSSILHYSESVSKVADNAISIDVSKSHNEYWDEMKSKGQLDGFGIPHHLQEEYFFVPRGRVLFLKATGVFMVYHGNVFSASDKLLVKKTFLLPSGKTRFEQDEHYTII